MMPWLGLGFMDVLRGLGAPALLIHEAVRKRFASLPVSDAFRELLEGESCGRKALPCLVEGLGAGRRGASPWQGLPSGAAAGQAQGA